MVKSLDYAKKLYQEAISREETAKRYCEGVGTFLGIEKDKVCKSVPAKRYAEVMTSKAEEIAKRWAEGLKAAFSV